MGTTEKVMKDLKKEIRKKIKEYGLNVYASREGWSDDTPTDGDLEKEVGEIINYIKTLLQEEREKGRKEGMAGKVFNKIEINEEVQMPTELLEKIKSDERKKTLEEVKNSFTIEDLDLIIGVLEDVGANSEPACIKAKDILSKLIKEKE